jgi:chemotaxis protein histidine kinase CheA
MSLPEILREFLLETHENLALLDANLIRLEKNPTERETLAEVFRTLHSVKGTAGFMGLAKLETIAHAAESLLAKLRAGELIFNPEIATALLRVVDAIRDILSHIEASTGEGDTDYGPLAQELDRLRTGDANRSDSQSTASMPPVAPASTASPHNRSRFATQSYIASQSRVANRSRVATGWNNFRCLTIHRSPRIASAIGNLWEQYLRYTVSRDLTNGSACRPGWINGESGNNQWHRNCGSGRSGRPVGTLGIAWRRSG